MTGLPVLYPLQVVPNLIRETLWLTSMKISPSFTNRYIALAEDSETLELGEERKALSVRLRQFFRNRYLIDRPSGDGSCGGAAARGAGPRPREAGAKLV